MAALKGAGVSVLAASQLARAGWRAARQIGRRIESGPKLLGPLLVGAGLRLLAALSGWGFFASDDYLYVIAPAAAWLEDPHASYPSEWRSVLLARAFWLLLAAGRALGLSDPAALLRFAYAGLGAWSLLTIAGIYFLAAERLDKRTGLVAAYLAAAYALLPRLTTRALIEVACMPPLVWGLALAQRGACRPGLRPGARMAWGALAGGLLGLAAMLRFQVAVVFATVGLVLWFVGEPGARDGATGRWDGWSLFKPRRAGSLTAVGVLLGGLVAAGLEGLLDWYVHGGWWAAPLRYLAFNWRHAADFGVSPWYTYLLTLLLVWFVPAVPLLWRQLGAAARAAPLVAWPVATFVAAHSYVGHKEDRFLFPLLPLALVLVAAALTAAWQARGWQRAVVRLFVVFQVVALLVATLSDGQRSTTVPLLEVARAAEPRLVVWASRRNPPLYYLGGRAGLVRLGEGAGGAAGAPAAWGAQLAEVPLLATRFVFDAPLPAWVSASLSARGFVCAPQRQIPGDWSDRLVVWLNPRRNARRLPTVVVDCEVAAGG